MTAENTRLNAIRVLLDDEDKRKIRENWEMVLTDESLQPSRKTPAFEQEFYQLLIQEMEEGYRRKETLQREKRKKTGRSSGYIPPQMRISPDIGRFLFACFKWHGFNPSQTSAKVEAKGLDDLAEAFGFKVDVKENERQFMLDEVRTEIIDKEEGQEYNLRVWAMIIGGLFISFWAVIRFFMRRNGI